MAPAMPPPSIPPAAAHGRGGPAPRRRASRLRYVALAGLAALAVAFAVAAVVFVGRVRQLRDLRATGPGWTWPSRLYTADLRLVPGDLTPVVVERELTARGYRRS